MNIGYIYKITNQINGKCYIGQTSDSIEHRFREHIYDSRNRTDKRKDYPLYRAFRKYGIESFSIEEIEQCKLEDLDEREIYWISYFDSKNKGYNQFYGGSGGKRYNLDEEDVLKKYSELQNISEVAKKFNVDVGVITRILRKHNVKTLSQQDVIKNKNRTVYQYDKENNLLNIFNSFTDAGQWLRKNNLSKAKNDVTAGSTVLYCLQKGKTECLGYFWRCEPDYSEEEIKHFLSRIEKQNEKAKQKRKLEQKREFEQKQIKQESTLIKSKKTSTKPKTKKISVCPICGSKKESKSLLCKKCYEKQLHNTAEKQREEKYCITREILKLQIREMPFLQIGKLYGISGNAVRKWCKRYNLPYKASEIKKYSDEEWEKI